MTTEEPDAPAEPGIFVSYARGDRGRAQRLVEALEARGFTVWWDGLLGAGERFAPAIEAELEGAGTVIVLWSARSVRSHWVLDEASRGRDRGCLVPVSIDRTESPLGFRQLQSLDLSRWRGGPDAPEISAIVDAIGRTDCAPNRAAARAQGPALTSRRRVMAIGAAAVVATLGGMAAWRGGLLGAAVEAGSIAVLPFRNLSGDATQDYISDGLAEELRATLSRTGQLDVAAQTSSDSFRDGRATAEGIAKALDVAWILEGSVRRSSERMRVTAQLVDGNTGFETWSDTFDNPVGDILEVQARIATSVADALSARLVMGEGGIIREGGTSDAAALDDYLKGAALYQSTQGEEADRQALAAFDRAIGRDPEYAAAHAARSRVLTYIASNYVQGQEIAAAIAAALDSARRAIALAPKMAEGHSALGFGLMNGQLDLEQASGPYRKSYDLGFGSAAILSQFAYYAADVGDFATGRRAIERAKRLDPLNDGVFRAAANLAFFSRDFDLAGREARHALSINPGANVVHRILGDIALLGGRLDDARAEYAAEPSALSRLRGLAIVEGRTQGRAAADRRLSELARDYGDSAHYQQAQALAQLGRREEALQQLAVAFEHRDPGLVWTASDPLLDPLRQEGGFADLMAKLRFPGAEPATSGSALG